MVSIGNMQNMQNVVNDISDCKPNTSCSDAYNIKEWLQKTCRTACLPSYVWLASRYQQFWDELAFKYFCFRYWNSGSLGDGGEREREGERRERERERREREREERERERERERREGEGGRERISGPIIKNSIFKCVIFFHYRTEQSLTALSL